MNKKTIGMLKIAYAKVISVPPVGYALNTYKQSKIKKKQKKYQDYLSKIYKDYHNVNFYDTTFIEKSANLGGSEKYAAGFDILGYLDNSKEEILIPFIDRLCSITADEEAAFRIAVTDNSISPVLAEKLNTGCGLYVLTKACSYILTDRQHKIALIYVDTKDIKVTNQGTAFSKQFLANMSYARAHADYILVYALNKDGFDADKLNRAVANLGADSVIQSDCKAVALGQSVKRRDGIFVNSVTSTGHMFGQSDCQNGASVIIRHKLIQVPKTASAGFKYMLNKCYVPVFVEKSENGFTLEAISYEDCKNNPYMLKAYKYVKENQGRYNSFDDNLTVGSICETISASIPAEYSYMENVSVGRFTTQWFESAPDDAFFFNEPYHDVNDVIEKPLKVRLIVLEKALEKGVSFVFTYVPLDSEIPHIVLDSPMESHITLSASVRDRYPLKTVGITGSIGKTSTKDMLYEVLRVKYDTDRNLRNTNTQVNIGMHVQNFREWNEIFIQEIGGGRRGGASRHSRMIHPDAAVITNIGDAHIGNHGSREALMINKLGITDGLKADGTLYLNGDDPLLSKASVDVKTVFYAVHNKNSDYYADNIRENGDGIDFDICHGDQVVSVHLNVLGEHNVLNAVCCFAIAKQFELSDEEIRQGLLGFRTSGVRQNMIKIADYNVFVDCFNASPDSIDSSLSTLDSVSCDGKKIAVIGDVTGAASMAKKLHNTIGKSVINHSMDMLICYGPNSRIVHDIAQKAGINTHHFSKPKELESFIKQNLNAGDVILFKGSSKMKLAQRIDNLFGTMMAEQMYTDTVKLKHVKADGLTIRYCPAFATVEKASASLVESQIPKSVKGKKVCNIANEAFKGCETLKKVRIPSYVRYIGKEAFSGCSQLTDMVLPASVKFIDEKAFAGCTALKHINIPKDVIYISPDAFEGCDNLKYK